MSWNLSVFILAMALISSTKVSDASEAAGHGAPAAASGPSSKTTTMLISPEAPTTAMNCSEFLWQSFVQSLGTNKTGKSDSHTPTNNGGKTWTAPVFNFTKSNCTDKNEGKWTIDTKRLQALPAQFSIQISELKDNWNSTLANFQKAFTTAYHLPSKALQEVTNITMVWFKNGTNSTSVTTTSLTKSNGTTTMSKNTTKTETDHKDAHTATTDAAGGSGGPDHGGLKVAQVPAGGLCVLGPSTTPASAHGPTGSKAPAAAAAAAGHPPASTH